MAHRPQRSAKLSTPRPAPNTSAGVARPVLWQRMAEKFAKKVADKAAEVRQHIDAGNDLWQAATGGPMPRELDEIQAAAVRFGLSPDAALAGDFTLADVTTLMAGKRLAAIDEWNDRVHVAEAEAAVRRAANAVTPGATMPTGIQAEAADDEYADIARRLSDKARRTVALMHGMKAFSRGDSLTRQFLADELGIEIDDMRVIRVELGKSGRVLLESATGCRGGWWLTPDGVRVAKRVAA